MINLIRILMVAGIIAGYIAIGIFTGSVVVPIALYVILFITSLARSINE